MKYLGIDYGSKRVGIAISDESGKLAFPKKVLENNRNLVSQVAEIASEEKIVEIIIGESNDLDGRANDIMTDIIRFKDALEPLAGITVHFEPEFFSTAQAERIQGKSKNIDASAAAIILQSHLDRKHHGAI